MPESQDCTIMSFKKQILYHSLLLSIVLGGISCGSSKPAFYDPREVSLVSERLGIPLSNKNKDDDKNMPLYAEASTWIGVPYRYGGNTKKGVDCSGLTSQMYKKIYRRNLPRTSAEQSGEGKDISKSKLQPGDLVFFATSSNKKQINHVGVILKNGYFIHASSSRGVTVNHIEEKYYKDRWKKAKRL